MDQGFRVDQSPDHTTVTVTVKDDQDLPAIVFVAEDGTVLGAFGPSGFPVMSVVAGDGITVDMTDPLNPIVSVSA